MTPEDKELLLKDLCARLPYGVICTGKYWDCWDDDGSILDDSILKEATGELTQVRFTKNCCDVSIGLTHESDIETVKPYLRPTSSMTDEEKEEFWSLGGVMSYSPQHDHWAISAFSPEAYDWLNRKMFDYRDLIPKDLAIEVTKENNPYK